MPDAVANILPWACSAVCVVWLWLYGRKSPWGPIVGFFGQGVWVAYVIVADQWGLMPCVIIFAAQHAWNWYKWRQGKCPTK